MRTIKLSGRERAVLKAIGFADAVPGSAIAKLAQMPSDDLTDVLNALLAAGYDESKPYREQISTEECRRRSSRRTPATSTSSGSR
jgi:hypothetical protein